MACVAGGLSDRHRTLSVDLVGHGRSAAPRDAAAYSMAACVGQLASVLEELDVHDAHLIGYSMGGRVALAFCVAHPARVASALLVGASAGFRDPQQRMDRARDDEALAERIEREGVEAFVEFWLSQPFLVDERRLGARGVAELDPADPRFDSHEKRCETNRLELIEVLGEAFRRRPAGHWRTGFNERNLSADVIEDYSYPAQDELARRNRYVVELDHPSHGAIKTLGLPIFMSESPARLHSAAPSLGQHSAEILCDLLGYSEDEIVQLQDDGVIA